MLELKDDYLVYCKCLKEHISFKRCKECVNYTNETFIDLDVEKKKSTFCNYDESKLEVQG